MFNTQCANHTGMTLIEMMMSLVIASIIMASIYTYLLASHDRLDKQVTLARQNESINAVRRLLQSEIKHAGQIGCMALAENSISPFGQYSLTPANKLTGSGMATLTVRYVQFPTANVISTNKTSLRVNQGDRFANNEILIISDCQHGEIFQAKYVEHSVREQRIIPVKSLQYHYDADAEVGKLVVNHIELHGDRVYLKDIHGRQTEIANLMQGIMFYFAIINNNHLTDTPANQVTDWTQVKGVAIDIPPNRHLFVAMP